MRMFPTTTRPRSIFARKGIPYLNIEADVSHLDEQTEMVRVAREMIVELGLIPR